MNRLFLLVYTNQNNNAKRFKLRRYYLPKGIIDNHNFIINWKSFYDQPIDSDKKRYEEIEKFVTKGEDYTSWCLLDYDYIKNHYRLIAIDLSRQKWLDADLKAIQQIEFVGQLNNPDNVIVANKSMFVFAIFKKIKETRLFFFKEV